MTFRHCGLIECATLTLGVAFCLLSASGAGAVERDPCSSHTFGGIVIGEPDYDDQTVDYYVSGIEFESVPVAEYQRGDDLEANDFVCGGGAVAVRLGQQNSVLLLSAFEEHGGDICASHMILSGIGEGPLRLNYIGERNGVEAFGMYHGSDRELYKEVGIRRADFAFVWRSINPGSEGDNTPFERIPQSPEKTTIDGGCEN